MFQLTRPSPAQIDGFLARQSHLPFSYSETEATRGGAPPGYVVDHNRLLLGRGQAVFEAAVAALRRWEQFQLGWVSLCWPTTPLEPGATVGILARFLGLYALSACRILYVVDEAAPVRKVGFAYGTLPGHVARGEERFTVEWHADTDRVYYDILAFSRPRSALFRLGTPVTRLLQKRFAADSKQAMLRVVGQTFQSAR